MRRSEFAFFNICKTGVICALALAANISAASSADGTMQSAWARGQVAPYFEVPAFSAPGPSIDAAAAKGKTVFVITASSTIPFLAAINNSIKTVAEKVGLNYVDYPNQGQAQQWSQGIQQAVAMKADVLILLGAPNPELLQPQLAEARQSGVKVLVSYLYADGSQLPQNVDALVTVPSHEHMRLVADYAIAMSEEPVNALILVDRQFESTAGMEAALVDEMTTRCGSDCKVRVADVPVAEWATKIPAAVQAALSADAGVNWIMPIYDGMAAGAVSGVNLVGAQDRVRITTADASLFALRYIQDENVIVEDGGTSGDWAAWATIDQALRMITGMKPVDNVGLPIRMFDKRNIDQTGNPPVQNQGWGDSYVSGYSKLWGLD